MSLRISRLNLGKKSKIKKKNKKNNSSCSVHTQVMLPYGINSSILMSVDEEGRGYIDELDVGVPCKVCKQVIDVGESAFVDMSWEQGEQFRYRKFEYIHKNPPCGFVNKVKGCFRYEFMPIL